MREFISKIFSAVCVPAFRICRPFFACAISYKKINRAYIGRRDEKAEYLYGTKKEETQVVLRRSSKSRQRNAIAKDFFYICYEGR